MIKVEHLSKIYGSTVAIEDVDFTVETGEIIGFLGPNGAGKTTTMRILAGYLPATSGTAKIAGYDVHQQSMEVRRRIGYLPENPPLYPDMTVEGFLNFVAKIKGVKAKNRQQKVQSAIHSCQLEDKAKIAIRKLSKGYRQRVGIAQAIVHDPAVIILDEPTVGLDPRQIIEVRNLIKSLAGDHTIILSSHILPEVSAICDRVTIINRGKIVATSTPLALQEQLTASHSYELELEGNIQTLLSKLADIPGVLDIQHLTAPESENEHSILKVTCNGSDLGKELTATIVSQGIGLHEMRRTRPSLEDVFLQLTTEESDVELK
ncbi:ABC-type multidrug transport system, ATPase component [Hyella patelloides LEGE 07179]|uniref:ABC-type multidrug transport system, ATPase component n=1 Tax=Hyella patelloides LEGE 07179 TaxID=945734 RepID=A0A563W563_9CYAN|nr:ABC transporter ATP-binding protein [Hyella patelloides]VEP18805.1 ABC-type multidrug transport system, ATPase component [Hyella patelloides LEGE 07179]